MREGGRKGVREEAGRGTKGIACPFAPAPTSHYKKGSSSIDYL